MRVEITLKSGTMVAGYATSLDVVSDEKQGPPRSLSWVGNLKSGVPLLKYVNLEEVAAVVVFPEASDFGSPRPVKP